MEHPRRYQATQRWCIERGRAGLPWAQKWAARVSPEEKAAIEARAAEDAKAMAAAKAAARAEAAAKAAAIKVETQSSQMTEGGDPSQIKPSASLGQLPHQASVEMQRAAPEQADVSMSRLHTEALTSPSGGASSAAASSAPAAQGQGQGQMVAGAALEGGAALPSLPVPAPSLMNDVPIVVANGAGAGSVGAVATGHALVNQTGSAGGTALVQRPPAESEPPASCRSSTANPPVAANQAFGPPAGGLIWRTPGGPSKAKGVRQQRCGRCAGCTKEDCGRCKCCLDKPKFGGPGRMKQTCVHRACSNKGYDANSSGKLAATAAAEMLVGRELDKEDDALSEDSFSGLSDDDMMPPPAPITRPALASSSAAATLSSPVPLAGPATASPSSKSESVAGVAADAASPCGSVVDQGRPAEMVVKLERAPTPPRAVTAEEGEAIRPSAVVDADGDSAMPDGNSNGIVAVDSSKAVESKMEVDSREVDGVEVDVATAATTATAAAFTGAETTARHSETAAAETSAAAVPAASPAEPHPEVTVPNGAAASPIGESTRSLFRAAAAAAIYRDPSTETDRNEREDAAFGACMPCGGQGPPSAAKHLCALCGGGGGGNHPCGRLLPLGVDVWVHVNCALWSSEVFEKEPGVMLQVSPPPSTCAFPPGPHSRVHCNGLTPSLHLSAFGPHFCTMGSCRCLRFPRPSADRATQGVGSAAAWAPRLDATRSGASPHTTSPAPSPQAWCTNATTPHPLGAPSTRPRRAAWRFPYLRIAPFAQSR